MIQRFADIAVQNFAELISRIVLTGWLHAAMLNARENEEKSYGLENTI